RVPGRERRQLQRVAPAGDGARSGVRGGDRQAGGDDRRRVRARRRTRATHGGGLNGRQARGQGGAHLRRGSRTGRRARRALREGGGERGAGGHPGEGGAVRRGRDPGGG